MRKHIFNAGPCKLPDMTLENTAKAVMELGNCGQSILEVSHRSADFQAVYDETVALFKEVLNIPDNYSVIFFTGILICPSLRSVFLDTSLSPHSLTINIISHKIYNLVPKLILYNMSCFFNYPETFFNYI